MKAELKHEGAYSAMKTVVAGGSAKHPGRLKLDESMLAAAVDCLGGGIFVCQSPWPDCPIVYVSQTFTVITQYTAEEVLGRNLVFLVNPEANPHIAEGIRRALAQGAPFRAEFQCPRKEGPPVWCELMLTTMPAGRARGFVAGLLTDITQRKQREEEFREAEAKYRGIFDNAVEGIYQSTPDGRYLAVNRALARMYGYETPGELLAAVSDIGNQIYVDPVLRERFQREVEQTGQVHNMEYQVRRRDGSIIWISESARAVHDTAGRTPCYYEGFIEDITLRKEAEIARARLEKQMVHAQKMEAIGTLAGGIAHDFNNILCAMLGLTELSLASEQVTGLTRKNLESVLKSAGRAKDLIRQILTFSRRGGGERVPVRAGQILRECVKLLNATLPSSIEIECDIQTAADTIVADPTELHQVIMNLGTNAAFAMRANGGHLKYELFATELSDNQAAALPPLRAGPHVGLAVRDTGHGISREVMDHIFEPFFTTKPAGEGTGLGLALVHRIVTRCAGHVAVESQENQGATFRILVPRALQNAANAAQPKTQLLPGRGERVLVVDDEIPILSMLQQHLRKLGYRVITRADSTAALETIQAEPWKFDLIITDHTMPSLQGAELAEKIGGIRPDMPIILMTGLNQPPSFAGSPYAERRAVLKKPLDFVELSHRLREFLDAPGMQAREKAG